MARNLYTLHIRIPATLRSFLRGTLLTCWLSPRSRVPLEKLTGSQLVKKFPAFYGTTRKFITAFTSARHLTLELCDVLGTQPPTAGSGPDKKIAPPPTNKSRRPKILDTKPERQNLNSKAIWAWSERGNLCSRQIMILPGKTKNICNTVGSRALFRIAGTPGNLYCLLLSSLVSITSGIHPSHDYDTEMDSEGLIREFVRFMKLHTWSFR